MNIYVPFNESDKMRDLYIELEDMFTWSFEDENGSEYKLKSVYTEKGKVEQIYSTKYSGTFVRVIIQDEANCYRTIVELIHEDENKKYTIVDWNYSYSKKEYFTKEDTNKIDDFQRKVYEQLTIFNPYTEGTNDK